MISDPTLRDGSHAISHQLTKEQIELYSRAADNAGVHVIEVGHGNGLGASSLQVGESYLSDVEMLSIARENIKNAKLGIHVIPGFATIKKDLEQALALGVDVVRVASHCTEADITKRHIGYVRDMDKEVYGVLMMTHMTSTEHLVEEAKKMESYGAMGVIIMDSAGAFLMEDVKTRISSLVENLKIPVGFHAHNNLGLSIANSVTAVQEGATIIDATSKGFGAGAGNTPLEVLVSVLKKYGYLAEINLKEVLELAKITDTYLVKSPPTISVLSLVSGLAGVFSGFSKPVERLAKEYSIDPIDIFFELGKRKVVAGQEDIIIEVVQDLLNKSMK
jgi:4-hydroxy 2-oxovalerate aldolase